jgi:diguanylate cyclase (GGDEF)-like protein/PAS domain S-box-containing protein
VKRYLIFDLLVLIVFIVTSTSLYANDSQIKQTIQLSTSEKLWLQQHPVIRFAGDPNWLPFEAFDQSGNYIGIVAENLALIEQTLNIRFEKVVTQTWSESVNLAKSGEVDVLSETDDSALKSHLLFTDFYVTNPVVIVMGVHQNFVENLQQIKSKRIGIIRDYGYVTKITTNYPDHQFVIVEDIQDGLLAVSTGKVDALLCTITLCGYTISQLSLHDVKVVGKTEFETRLAFGVNKKFAPLVPILNKAIANITTKQHQQILDHWALKEYINKQDFAFLWQLILISALIVSFLVYRQLQLKAYNRKLSLSEERYARVVRGTSDGIWDWDLINNSHYFSPRFKVLLGFSETEMENTSDPIFNIVHPDDMGHLKHELHHHLTNHMPYQVEVRLKKKNGLYHWYETSGQAEWDKDGNPVRMSGALTDIEARKLREALDSSRNTVLELIARNDDFEKILHAIIASIENEKPQMLSSILILDDEQKRLFKGAAPSLPDFYNDAINGLEIGDGVGSCGTAAATGKRVIVNDIQSHTNWIEYRELAKKANLASCWSEPILNARGSVVGTFAVYQDKVSTPTANDILVIEQAATLAGIAIEKHKINEELQLASLVYKYSSEAMLIFDHRRTILSVNPAFSKITGYQPDEVLGHKADILNSEFHDEKFYNDIREKVDLNGFWQGEVIDRRKNGEIFSKWLIVNTIFNDDGSVHRRLSLFSDITEKRKSEKIIWKQANFDSLTGLANRNMFHERLAREINHSQRDKLNFALLLIDLDHFKEINDTLGHDMGDILLIEASRRISSAVRETDTVARLGGDEFTIIVTQVEDPSNVERVAQSIVDRLAEPFKLNDESVYVSASIGITLFPEDSTQIDVLLKNADQAMYESKKLGRNRYQYFTRSMQEIALQRMSMISELRQAISEQQFTLVYQPIVELSTNKTIKAEALIRWKHPEKGLIDPVDFIPITEETGMIVIIGDWVLKNAANQIAIWRKSISPDFQISVNTSPVQYQSSGFDFKDWSKLLSNLDLPGEAIIIEITEGLMMDVNNLVSEQLLEFRNMGIQVALDDFGTGYSSLSYLNKFDIDYIKIDQSFVKDLESENNNRELCEAIVVMAHKLNLKVIAEGVETETQKEILKCIGCDYGQGYLFSKPISAQAFEKYIGLESKT